MYEYHLGAAARFKTYVFGGVFPTHEAARVSAIIIAIKGHGLEEYKKH